MHTVSCNLRTCDTCRKKIRIQHVTEYYGEDGMRRATNTVYCPVEFLKPLANALGINIVVSIGGKLEPTIDDEGYTESGNGLPDIKITPKTPDPLGVYGTGIGQGCVQQIDATQVCGEVHAGE